MDQNRFDVLTQWLTHGPSRRDVLRGLITAGLGLGSMRLPDLAEAKRKGKRKKITRNAFGCVDVGGFCKNGGQCCSGICEGKKGKKKCKAHDASTCRGQDGCAGEPGACTTTAGDPGECVVTTGNASYCLTNAVCVDCATDADCVPFCGAGAACIVCAECAATERETACASTSEVICVSPM